MANLGFIQFTGNILSIVRDTSTLIPQELSVWLNRYNSNSTFYLAPIYVENSTKLIRFPTANVANGYGSRSFNPIKVTYSTTSQTVKITDKCGTVGIDESSTNTHSTWKIDFNIHGGLPHMIDYVLETSLTTNVYTLDDFTSISTHTNYLNTGVEPNCILMIKESDYAIVEDAVNKMINTMTTIPRYAIYGISNNNDVINPITATRKMLRELDFTLLCNVMNRIMGRYVSVDPANPNGVFNDVMLNSLIEPDMTDSRDFYGSYSSLQDLINASTTTPPDNNYTIASISVPGQTMELYIYDVVSGTWLPYVMHNNIDSTLILNIFTSTNTPVITDTMNQYFTNCINGINSNIKISSVAGSSVKLSTTNGLMLNPQKSGTTTTMSITSPDSLTTIFTTIINNTNSMKNIFNSIEDLVTVESSKTYITPTTTGETIFMYCGDITSSELDTLITSQLGQASEAPYYRVYSISA